MKNIIQLIKEHKFTEAEDRINSLIPLIMEKKIFEMKKAVAAKMSEQMGVGPTMQDKRESGVVEEKEEKSEEDDDKEEKEEEELDEARISIVRARVRGGKIQRRKKVSNVPGMTLRGGTLKRMSAAERRRRKMGARRGKVKRRAKLSRSLMKRKRSLQKRKSLGL
jgi:ribosomal protein L12E/L44/L45/RPP1/RPP2